MAKTKAIILNNDGTFTEEDILEGHTVVGNGTYVFEPKNTYLRKGDTHLGRKWRWFTPRERKFVFFTAGDPEPLGHRKPVGLTAQDVRMLSGPLLPRLLAPALGDQEKTKLNLKLIGLVLVGALVAGGIIFRMM